MRADCDVTVILRVCNDEERVGHAIRRVATHLKALELRSEILVADEGSGDNTVALATLLHREFGEIQVLHAESGAGYERAAAQARGRNVLLYDVAVSAPLSALAFALSHLADGDDVVSVRGKQDACLQSARCPGRRQAAAQRFRGDRASVFAARQRHRPQMSGDRGAVAVEAAASNHHMAQTPCKCPLLIT
jgi:hypothetical protein